MLRRFRLENCLSIQQLPKCIGALTNLYELDLSGCANLSMLSSEIGNLVRLNKLNLSYCKSLVRLPSEIGCLKNLTSLNLAHLMIMSLPVEIGHLRALEDLSLSGCTQLDKLPKEIGFLASLLRLNLSSCTALKELPKEIGKLISLQRLSLNSCSALSRLPDEFYELVSLQSLDLDYCKLLAHLSPAICNLRSLQRLSLNCCTRLTWLPTEITTLPSIQVVNLVGCTGLKPEQPKEMQKITRENSRAAHKDHSDLVTLEGPKNRSFKLYSMTNWVLSTYRLEVCTYLRHHRLQDAAQFSAANSILKWSFRTTAKDDKYDSSSQLVGAQVWLLSSFSTTVIVCDVRNSNLGVTFPAAPEHHEWSFWVSPSGLKSWTCLDLKPWMCLGLESWMCFIAGLSRIWKILVRSFKTGLPYVGHLWVAVINQ